MNVGGGEAADQLVRMMLTGSEEIIKLSGSLLKNLLAITIAAAKHNKKISGKVNLAKMLRETRDVRYFNMTPETYEKFKKMAKKQGLLFSAIKDKDDRGALVEVVLPATELDRANLIFERLGYDQAAEMSAEREVQPTLRAKVKQAFQKVKTKVKEKLHIKDVSENERTPLGKRIKFWMTLAKEKFKARFGIKDRDVEAEETGTPDRETGGPDREGGDEPDRDFASTERDAESPDRESGTPERVDPAPEEMPTPEEGHRDPFPVPEGRGDTPPDRESGTPETAGPETAAPDRDGSTPERTREGPDRTADGSTRAAGGAAETGARDGPDVPEGRESPARGSPSPQDSHSSRPSSSTSRKPGSSTMTNRNRQERVSIIARLEGFKAMVDAQVHEQELESGIETGKESAPEAGAARESGTTGKEPAQAVGKDDGREGATGAERVLDKGKSRETGKAGPKRGGKRLAKKKGKGPKIGKRLKKAVR